MRRSSGECVPPAPDRAEGAPTTGPALAGSDRRPAAANAPALSRVVAHQLAAPPAGREVAHDEP